jgi:3-phenylpropionate/trans-cinnamate dioxygenase ferredoxin reductase subunit
VDRTEIAIVGGGLASARLVSAYREAGGDAPVTLVSADTEPPYHRPPLSKKVLRGEAEPESALVEPASWYAEHEVDLRLRTRVASLDLGARALALEDGARLGFDRLVIASGAWPRTLDVPGAGLDGVLTLRTMDDARAIRAHAESAGAAVVVGTGFIGLETTASLRAIGVDVTLVTIDDALFQTLEAPPFSEHLAAVYRDHGVDVRLGESVAEFVGDGVLRAARLSGGDEAPAELAIVGIGVAPVTGWLDGAVALDERTRGVVVDERYATSADGVYAVGDVAAFWDPVFGRRRRIEHWSNANLQGAQLGRILAGSDESYDAVSSFFTELFGTSYRVHGDTTGADELVLDGDFAAGAAVLRYGSGGGLVAALVAGQTDEAHERLKQEIRERAPLRALS